MRVFTPPSMRSQDRQTSIPKSKILNPKSAPTSLLLICTLFLAVPAFADDELIPKKDDRHPSTVSLDDPPEMAIKKLAVGAGLKVELWAAEPLLANPVAFTFDEKGRAFVAETYRRKTSVPDIRRNMSWLSSTLAMRTVEDRVVFLQKVYAPEKKLTPSADLPDQNHDGQFDWRDWTVESERIKLLEDQDHDGKADHSSVFAEGFQTLATGTAAGVLARHGDVWYACRPDLWHLRDGGNGQASEREILLSGFGVHVAFGGHDLHGLRFGPDGRLYWTVADCGAHVTSKNGKPVSFPDGGAVFRSNPDGTELELYAWGLRNPDHLAFNDFGDLFTGDNNADGGDKARWVHVVEGGESGWRIGWQFLPKLGAWNTENLWGLDVGKTALSLIPPVAHIGHGPAGISYYPGTGLPDRFREHFFYADFPGGVRTFTLQPQGASYRCATSAKLLEDNSPTEMQNKVLWGLYPSDVQFGVDGGVYILDWVFGWDKTGKGRIYRVHDPATSANALTQETKKLLAEGMSQRSPEELAKLLGHADQRVRLEAQFALAEKQDITTLTKVATGKAPLLAQIHAIWGLGQIARKIPQSLVPVTGLLRSTEPELRAQAAHVLGDQNPFTHDRLTEKVHPIQILLQLALKDEHPRVRFFAAMALSKIGDKESVQPVFAMLRENANKDSMLRHAGVMALAACADPATLAGTAQDPSEAIRAAGLLALRRQSRSEVSIFLRDHNAQLALEAARAIHDAPIEEAIPRLAETASETNHGLPYSRRAVNAAYLIGDTPSAQRLASLASDGHAPEAMRLDALEALAQWNETLGHDRVLGTFRSFGFTREAAAASRALEPSIAHLFEHGSEPVRVAALEAVRQLKIQNAEPALLTLIPKGTEPGTVRAAALKALEAIQSNQIDTFVEASLQDRDQVLADTALDIAAKRLPERALERIGFILERQPVAQKEKAVRTLAEIEGDSANIVVGHWMDELIAGRVPPEIQLDLLLTAAARHSAPLDEKVRGYESSLDPNDPLAEWRVCLAGGDGPHGKQVFNENAGAGCMRCHKFDGIGGSVGPDLAGIGKRVSREYLLEAIVAPNRTFAPGYETVTVLLRNGDAVAGLLSKETATELILVPPGGGKPVTIKKTEITDRIRVPSPMPEGLGTVLGKKDLRDVVQYLFTWKPKEPAGKSTSNVERPTSNVQSIGD